MEDECKLIDIIKNEQQALTTYGDDAHLYIQQSGKFNIHDTHHQATDVDNACQQRFCTFTKNALCSIIVFDMTDKESFNNVQNQVDKIDKHSAANELVSTMRNPLEQKC